MDDAEKVKIKADDLFKNSDSQHIPSQHNENELHDKSLDKKDEDQHSKKTDILDVSSLNFEGVKTISRKLFNDIVEARVEEIFDLVIQNIEQSGNEFKLPAGIVVTGGSSEIPGITNIAKKRFGVPARIGTPRGLEGLVDGISSPAYAAAQGLIMYAMGDEIYRGDNKYSPANGSKKKTSGGIVSRVSGFFKNLMP